MAVSLFREQIKIRAVNGFKQYDATHIYKVTGITSKTTAAEASGVPPIGQAFVLATSGVTVWCHDIDAQRPHGIDSKTTWHVTALLSNNTEAFGRDESGNPTLTTTEQVKQVDVTYERGSQNVTNAQLIKMQYEDETGLTIPAHLSGYKGPVCNSARSPRIVTRPKSEKVFRVSKYLDSWPATFDDYIDSINSTAITFTQRDSTGTKATFTNAAKTLLMDDIIKHDIWHNGRLYFKAVFVMLYRKDTWTHIEIDAGTERVAIPQQTYNPKTGGKYSQDEVNDLAGSGTASDADSAYEPITVSVGKKGVDTTLATVAIGANVPFNGNGSEISNKNAAGQFNKTTVELHFDIFHDKTQDFNDLDL